MINKKSQQGVALITSVLLATVLLGIVFTFSAIFIPKIRTSSESKKTVSAVYAADSGLEWCLYIVNKDDIGNPETLQPVMSNGSTYSNGENQTLEALDCITDPLRILGVYQGVTRAFDIYFP